MTVPFRTSAAAAGAAHPVRNAARRRRSGISRHPGAEPVRDCRTGGLVRVQPVTSLCRQRFGPRPEPSPRGTSEGRDRTSPPANWRGCPCRPDSQACHDMAVFRRHVGRVKRFSCFQLASDAGRFCPPGALGGSDADIPAGAAQAAAAGDRTLRVRVNTSFNTLRLPLRGSAAGAGHKRRDDIFCYERN